MPKKKASGGKSDATVPATAINVVEVPKVCTFVALNGRTQIFVQIVHPSMLGAILNVRMVTWKYLNFQVKVRLNSRVFAIEEKIRQHHGGSVHQVFLYNGVVAPENLLTDPSVTLYEAGFEGDVEGKEPEFDVWYDFQPLQSSCPLLMATPNDREQRESPYRSISRNSNRSPSPPPGKAAAGASASATAPGKRGSVVDFGATGNSSPLANSTPVVSHVIVFQPVASVLTFT